MKTRSFWFFVYFLVPASLAAQQLAENQFDHYTTAEGLSHNKVSGISQDATGYIWITTASGLNRFDGSRFVQFHSNNDSGSLAAEELTGTTWLDKHRLAVFTTGLHIIDTRTGEKHNLFVPYHDKQFQYKFNMIERVMGCDNGDLFLLTRSGFYHYDKQYNLVYRFDYYAEKDVPVTHFFFGRELFSIDNQRLLIVSIAGLYIYNKKNRQVTKMTAADCPVMADLLNYPEPYYSFFQDKPGNFFLHKAGTDSLIYMNTRTNKKVVSLLPFKPSTIDVHYRSRLIPMNDSTFYLTGHISGFWKMHFERASGKVSVYPEKYFPLHFCSSILKDQDQDLWIATNKGIFRQNPKKSLVQFAYLPPGTEDTYPDLRLDDVYATGNTFYAAARGDAGLFLFDKNTLAFKKQLLFKNIEGRTNHLLAMTPVQDSTILIATHRPLLLYNFSSGKTSQLIPPLWTTEDWANDLYRDKKGNIWIGAYRIYRYNPVAGTFKIIPTHERILNMPSVIAEDTSGHIWIAGHGLMRYNTKAGMIDILLDSFPHIKMPDKQVNAMVIDSRNVVWFNSNNNGLVAYDITKRTFRHFTRKDGLPDDNIASMIVNGNKLWIACVSGLACMDLRSMQIVSFGKADGFPEMNMQRGARLFYDSTSRMIYLSAGNLVGRFDPIEMPRRKTTPSLFIESLVIDGSKKHFLPGNGITTSWKDKEMRITIGTINFSDGINQRFAYRIPGEGFTSWTQLGNQPTFSISGLSPGIHKIQVKVFSTSNRWPEQVKEITIQVLPPIWKKAWFIIMEAVLAIVLIWLLIRWRTETARKKEMVKTHIEKLKADDYKNRYELEQISHYFSTSLAGKKTKDEVLWDVAQNLIGRMNYEDCIIYVWNAEKTKMIQKAAWGPKGKPGVITEQFFDVLPGQGIVGHVMNTLQPELVHDTKTDQRYRVDDQVRRSEICVPIIANGELLGIIDSEHSLPSYYSERDIKILTTIATLVANKLKQIESEQTLEHSRKELASINEQLAEARLSALQAQMNPHFVFNALNSIKRMILDEDNEKASRYLSKFALMIRMTLNHSREIFVTLDENIRYLEAYLQMEQLRFDDSFCWSIEVDDTIDLSETAVPSMMIQPLVENAIWHGLMHATTEKKIVVAFAQKDNTIICTVEDNGIGIRKSQQLKEQHKTAHQSLGLDNLRHRIRVLNEKYNMDCRLFITDLKEENEDKNGTRVVVQFDLVNAGTN